MARESRFRNPEFQEKLARARNYERRVGSVGWRRILILAVGVVIIYFLAVSQKFLIKIAAVSEPGPTASEIEDVLARLQRQRWAYSIPKNHFLILGKALLLSEIQKELPEVRSITSFKKRWPDRVELILEEREPKYVWQSGADYFLLDQDGVVFQKIPAYTPEIFSQVLIVDSSLSPVKTGEELPVRAILSFVDSVKRGWALKINQTNYAHFLVPGASSQDIFAKTAIGFQVYFDLERDPVEQLDNLELLLTREILPETYTGLSYIDLRLPATAYYCYKDAPCAPEYQK